MSEVAEKQIGYFHGDAGEFTGNTEPGFRCTLYEIKMTEGHRVGQTKLVRRLYPAKPKR